MTVVLVRICVCENENSKGGKKLLLVATVIFVRALYQEGHQIANHPSITGSHHILETL